MASAGGKRRAGDVDREDQAAAARAAKQLLQQDIDKLELHRATKFICMECEHLPEVQGFVPCAQGHWACLEHVNNLDFPSSHLVTLLQKTPRNQEHYCDIVEQAMQELKVEVERRGKMLKRDAGCQWTVVEADLFQTVESQNSSSTGEILDLPERDPRTLHRIAVCFGQWHREKLSVTDPNLLEWADGLGEDPCFKIVEPLYRFRELFHIDYGHRRQLDLIMCG
jgi:hypothetical protein